MEQKSAPDCEEFLVMVVMVGDAICNAQQAGYANSRNSYGKKKKFKRQTFRDSMGRVCFYAVAKESFTCNCRVRNGHKHADGLAS